MSTPIYVSKTACLTFRGTTVADVLLQIAEFLVESGLERSEDIDDITVKTAAYREGFPLEFIASFTVLMADVPPKIREQAVPK